MRRFFTFFLLLVGLGFTQQARGQDNNIELSEVQCVGGANSAQQAFALAASALDCERPSYNRSERFVRGYAAIERELSTSAIPMWWQSDPAFYDSMLIRFTFADGTQRLVDVDPQMPARNWYAGDRFSVPVPEYDLPLVAVDTVVERPQATSTLRNARLVDARSASQTHFYRTLIYVLICGGLLVPLIYNLLFYRVLRGSFIAWHAGMVLAMLAYLVLSSGLVFLLLPDLPLWARWHGTYLALTLAIAFTAMFVLGLLERGVRSQWMRKVLVGSLMPVLFVQLFMILAGDHARMTVTFLYEASLIPPTIATLAILAAGVGRGSRAARWMTFSALGLVLAGVMRLFQELQLVSLQFALDDFIFAAMVLLAVGTSLAVGDRFMVMKKDRDDARSQAVRMERMASTDPLTSLLNRRAFNSLGELEQGRGLLIADIDRFKAINDKYGHPVGDAVLGNVAQVLRAALKHLPDARVYRLGGEEFAATCPAQSAAGLVEICEEIRTRIAERSTQDIEADLPVITVSIGAVLGRGQPVSDAFAQADSALYSAKAMGRNRSILYRHMPSGDLSADEDAVGPQHRRPGDNGPIGAT